MSSTVRTLLLIAGTRPEIIKQASLHRLASVRPGWRSRFVFTGQHREMGLEMLADLDLRADVVLDLMEPGQTPSAFLGRAVPELSSVIERERPDWVAVQGDTTTALAGALAGFYTQTPVLHVEAGLRTNNLALPFPEEGHRQLISRITLAHAAPTPEAAAALAAEGIPAARTCLVGNTGIDCLLQTISALRADSAPPASLPPTLAAELVARRTTTPAAPMVLVTMHRRESQGTPLRLMCAAFAQLAVHHPSALFVLPVHPNPAVRTTVEELLGGLPNLRLIAPQSYRAFAWLIDASTLLVTDSGGLQEEGPALGKPVLVLREVTERPEAIACGSARLIGCDPARIHSAVTELLTDSAVYAAMAVPRFPFGDGDSAARILDWLASLPGRAART